MISPQQLKSGKRQMCLRCVGQGHLSDSQMFLHEPSKQMVQSTASTCPDCRGKGLVLVFPIPDEEE